MAAELKNATKALVAYGYVALKDKMKTIICDIDGTIFKYQGGTPEVTNNRVEPLPGVIKQMNQWEMEGSRIIIITGFCLYVA